MGTIKGLVVFIGNESNEDLENLEDFRKMDANEILSLINELACCSIGIVEPNDLYSKYCDLIGFSRKEFVRHYKQITEELAKGMVHMIYNNPEVLVNKGVCAYIKVDETESLENLVELYKNKMNYDA